MKKHFIGVEIHANGNLCRPMCPHLYTADTGGYACRVFYTMLAPLEVAEEYRDLKTMYKRAPQCLSAPRWEKLTNE